MLRKKSLLALLLSLCMVVGILPATVFAAGQYVPENPRWSGYGNQVMWDKPANASGSTYLEYEARLVLNGKVLQTESVEIDRWVFFDSKNITQSKDAYTLKVRARQIYLTGDPDGYYTVWKRDAWGDWAIGGNTGGGEGPTPPHEHSFGGWKNNGTQHWKECRCGEKTEVGNHTFGDWTITKEPTTTETGSRERTCSICKYTQTETLPVHTHDVHDEAWKYDETQHWQECSCGEKLNVANHTSGDWKVTKEATETEAGSRERGCAVCEYVQTEAIPAAGTGEPTDSTDPTDSSDSQGQQDPSGDTGSPQTGDSSNMMLWISLMLASCGGVLGMLLYRRKKAAAGK